MKLNQIFKENILYRPETLVEINNGLWEVLRETTSWNLHIFLFSYGSQVLKKKYFVERFWLRIFMISFHVDSCYTFNSVKV